MSTFEIGIPAKRRVSTTSKRKSLRLAGNVVPLAFSCLSCLELQALENGLTFFSVCSDSCNSSQMLLRLHMSVSPTAETTRTHSHQRWGNSGKPTIESSPSEDGYTEIRGHSVRVARLSSGMHSTAAFTRTSPLRLWRNSRIFAAIWSIVQEPVLRVLP